MAQIRNVGPGMRTSGQTAGLVYVHVKGKTYSRALPILPASMFRTPEARKRQALFTLVSWHLKAHANTIKRTFSRGKFWSSRNNYFHHNAKALYAALDALADSYVEGNVVTVDQIEQAIAAYATSNPNTLQIGGLEGYAPVYLSGSWPDTITLHNDSGDNTTVVVVTSASQGGAVSMVTLTCSAGAGGSVSPTSKTVPVGTQVTFTASPNSGKQVDKWSNNSTGLTLTVTASENAAYSVSFKDVVSGGGSQGGGGDLG